MISIGAPYDTRTAVDGSEECYQRALEILSLHVSGAWASGVKPPSPLIFCRMEGDMHKSRYHMTGETHVLMVSAHG